jgi:copper transport protein
MIARFLALASLLLALALPLGAAYGHAAVVQTYPSDGAVLDAAPQSVRILFNEPVSLISAQVLDAGGRNIIAPDAAAAKDATIEITLPGQLERGTYVASYRIVSLDGHPVGGSLVFSIGEPSASPQPDRAKDDRSWRAAWMIVRVVFDAALLGSAGDVLFLLLVAAATASAASTARIAVWFAVVGVVAAILSIGVQGGLLRGASLSTITDAATWRIGAASTYGRSVLAASTGLLVIIASARLASGTGRMAALAGAATALASFAFAGHVVTAGPRWFTMPVVVAHTAAVAFWIGSLLPLRAALSHDDAVLAVRRFAKFAAVAIAILVMAGIVIAALQVRGFNALVTTSYGRLLLAKLALLCGLLSIASYNKWRLTPVLARGEAVATITLHRTIVAELALVAAILIVTTALGITPPPRAADLGPAENSKSQSGQEHHAHGLSLHMSNDEHRVTLSLASAQAGPNHIEIVITDAGGNPVEAKEVIFVALNPAAGVEPIRRMGQPIGRGAWGIKDLTLVPEGEWGIRVEALVSDFEKPIFEGAVRLQ